MFSKDLKMGIGLLMGRCLNRWPVLSILGVIFHSSDNWKALLFLCYSEVANKYCSYSVSYTGGAQYVPAAIKLFVSKSLYGMELRYSQFYLKPLSYVFKESIL